MPWKTDPFLKYPIPARTEADPFGPVSLITQFEKAFAGPATGRRLGLFQFTRDILRAALLPPRQANRPFRLDVAESPTRQFPHARRRFLAGFASGRLAPIVGSG